MGDFTDSWIDWVDLWVVSNEASISGDVSAGVPIAAARLELTCVMVF